jgi:hypothetical protein
VACGPSDDGPREESELAAQLEVLGYAEAVSSDPDPLQSGVTRHDTERAQAGINVYCSVRSPEIEFLDMSGNVLHTIRMPEAGVGADCMLKPGGDGEFLALVQPALMRIDWNSRVQWQSRRDHHHDFAVGAEGEVHTFSQRRGSVLHEGVELPILDEAIVVLDRSGKVVRELPFGPLFEDHIRPESLALMLLLRDKQTRPRYVAASDVYHPNTIVILEHDSALGKRGDWLVCLRTLDLIAVIDRQSGTLGWTWGSGELQGPHHPSILPNGNLLVFDNGRHRRWSRIVELDPASREIVWTYQADPPEQFFSKVRGSAQALANGNVLITESTIGRVFEVTREGDVVWAFSNPHRTAEGERRQIYRMLRVDPNQLPELAVPGGRVQLGGKRLRFTDQQRRKLAVKATAIGRSGEGVHGALPRREESPGDWQ